MRDTGISDCEAARMSGGSPVIAKKEAVEREDGRSLILYTFDPDSEKRDEVSTEMRRDLQRPYSGGVVV